jgi:hypothetical protein
MNEEKLTYSLDEFRRIGQKNLIKIVYSEITALQKEKWLPADRERKSRIITNLVRTCLMLEKGFADENFSDFMQISNGVENDDDFSTKQDTNGSVKPFDATAT